MGIPSLLKELGFLSIFHYFDGARIVTLHVVHLSSKISLKSLFTFLKPLINCSFSISG